MSVKYKRKICPDGKILGAPLARGVVDKNGRNGAEKQNHCRLSNLPKMLERHPEDLSFF
jgi:hypothetical protein